MRRPEGYLGGTPTSLPPTLLSAPAHTCSSPPLPLLCPLHLTGEEQTRLLVCSSLPGMHGDTGEALYVLTHITLCSYPLFPNVFLCTLLLRLSLKFYALQLD